MAKNVVVSVIVGAVVFLSMFYAYGNVVLLDQVVPAETANYIYGSFIASTIFQLDSFLPGEAMSIEQWVGAFQSTGIMGMFYAIICSVIWGAMADAYDGTKKSGNISMKYYIVFALAIVMGAFNAFTLPKAEAGAGLSFLIAFVEPVLVFWIASLIGTPAKAARFTLGGGMLCK